MDMGRNDPATCGRDRDCAAHKAVKYMRLVLGILVVPVILFASEVQSALAGTEYVRHPATFMLISSLLAYPLAIVAAHVISEKKLIMGLARPAVMIWALPVVFLLIAFAAYLLCPAIRH